MKKIEQDLEAVDNLEKARNNFFKEVGKKVVGQTEILEHLLISILTQGHSLLIGVPGLAKTLIIKTLSDVLELSFSRIQFTPDLMPSDITGTELIDVDKTSGKRSFRFFQGPIFSNIVLADEINRTPPKTQSALLEAMQEHNVTSGGQTYELDKPFFVLATQNPIEQEGTYPLPEAQLDRFMFNVLIDYPPFDDELDIVKSNTSLNSNKIKKIINSKELTDYQNLVKNVPVSDNVIKYAVNLVHNTRPSGECLEITKKYIDWGAGPRASSFLILAAKAQALLLGKATPDIDDVKKVAIPVLRHRIILNFNAEAEGIKIDDVLNELSNQK